MRFGCKRGHENGRFGRKPCRVYTIMALQGLEDVNADLPFLRDPEDGGGEVAVAGGVLFQVVLVVFFGAVEVLKGQEFDGEGRSEGGGAAVQCRPDAGNLVFRYEIDARAVARAFVLALFVEAERVDGLEEEIRQAFLRDDGGIILQMNRFGVAGPVRVHVLVGGVFGETVGKAHLGEGHALHLGEKLLGAPEASGGEIQVPGHRLLVMASKLRKKSVNL